MSKDNLVPRLPDDISRLSLGDLMQDDDTEIIKRGGKLKLKRNTPGSTIYVEYTEYPQGRTLSATEVDARGPKKGLARTVKQMRKEGMTYEEISKRTGMSTTYARKLYLGE